MNNPLAALREEAGTYLLDALLVGLAFLFSLFSLISLGQLGPAFQQSTNAAIVYAFFNIATLIWIVGAYATKNNPNSFFRFYGLNLKAPVWVVLFIVGVLLGVVLTPAGKAAAFGLLHPAASAASPDVITAFFFKNYLAPISETYSIVGVLFPFLYWILGGRSGKILEKALAFVVAMIISSSVITVMHVVIYSATLDQLPGLFIFFSVQSVLAFLFGSIAIALGMHFGLNLALPGFVLMKRALDELGLTWVFDLSWVEKMERLEKKQRVISYPALYGVWGDFA